MKQWYIEFVLTLVIFCKHSSIPLLFFVFVFVFVFFFFRSVFWFNLQLSHFICTSRQFQLSSSMHYTCNNRRHSWRRWWRQCRVVFVAKSSINGCTCSKVSVNRDDALSSNPSLAVFWYNLRTFPLYKLSTSRASANLHSTHNSRWLTVQLTHNSTTTAANPTYYIFSKSSPTKRIWIKNRVLGRIYKGPRPHMVSQK